MQIEEVAMQIEVVESVTNTIGSLALAYPYLRRLEVAETIASLVIEGTERMVPTTPADYLQPSITPHPT
jgi:uncharacterized protein with von Willebrand factor type A (vWA) domain